MFLCRRNWQSLTRKLSTELIWQSTVFLLQDQSSCQLKDEVSDCNEISSFVVKVWKFEHSNQWLAEKSQAHIWRLVNMEHLHMPSGGVKVFVQRHYSSVSSHPLNLLTAQGDKGSIRDLEREQTERSSHGLHARFCL